MRVLQESFRLQRCFPDRYMRQINFRHFLQDKIRQRRSVLIVWSAHLNAQSDPFIVLLRQVKNLLHIVG